MKLSGVQIVTNTSEQLSRSPREASVHVANMLQLRDVVRCIPPVAQGLIGCRSSLLLVIKTLLCDPRLGDIEALLFDSLSASAGLSKVRSSSIFFSSSIGNLLDREMALME